ncbi:class I SAM-dependent methyltransferase [Microvirga terricola]|uniref:Class I SAM-dependent methyltransferase n=1 Tax=Microvirga terricola TaxID=2719797 RepID=A0ABX0VFH0_9HYPH|nr:class I SAM-dependent methyltransferase [Microvirga terricola]NIX76662.1 class I SAM-dependent methyltransferase [Microvirga terricola]
MNDPTDDPLYRDPNLAQLYDAANRWGVDFDYCVTLAADAQSVLDLGCGTGELAAALAVNRSVTGVDPAGAMLDIARKRPGGREVTWVEADARNVRLGQRFDLIVLTGHVFQVFLTEDDQRAVLATIAAHLKPDGRFIFDSRNPAIRTWENRNQHNTLHRLDHPQLGPLEAWNEPSFDDSTNILTYENGYRILATGQAFSGSAQIRFTPLEELADMIAAAGLMVETWLGDWQGTPYHPDAKDIIPLGGLA